MYGIGRRTRKTARADADSPTESIDTGAESPMSKFLLHLFALSQRWSGR
jgi:hypothetical protein